MAQKFKNHPIFLIEDNPVDVDLTLRAFKSKNFTNPIEVARDGEQAIKFIDKWDMGESIPLVILLDLNLPKVEGLEVLKVFKEHPKYSTIPIVVLTSSSDNKDIEKAYKLGANSYIIKPVDFNKFVDVAAQIELYWNVLNEPLV